MPIWQEVIRFIDWFIPAEAKLERSKRVLAQNFVFTHLFGPALSQSISRFPISARPGRGLACWTVIVCVWVFWPLPFVYKFDRQPASLGADVGRAAGLHLAVRRLSLRRCQFAVPALADRRACCSASSICRSAPTADRRSFAINILGVLRRLPALGLPGRIVPRTEELVDGRAGSRSSRRRSTCRGWRSTTPT